MLNARQVFGTLLMSTALVGGFLAAGCASDVARRHGHAPVLGDTSSNAGRLPMLVAGEAHFCAYRGSSDLRCWGRNLQGELGDGSRMRRNEPQLVLGLPRGYQLRHLVAAADRTCATLTSGEVWCWGAGTDIAEKVDGLSAIRSVALAANNVCAMTELGHVLCRLRGKEPWEMQEGRDPKSWSTVSARPLKGLATLERFGPICGGVSQAKARCWEKEGRFGEGEYREFAVAEKRETLTLGGTVRSQRCFSGRCFLETPHPGATAVLNGCALSNFEVFCRKDARRHGALESTGLRGVGAIASWRDEATCAVPRAPDEPVLCDADSDGEFETAIAWAPPQQARALVTAKLRAIDATYRSRTKTVVSALEWRWRDKSEQGYSSAGGLETIYLLDGDFEKSWKLLGAEGFLQLAIGEYCEMGIQGAQRIVGQGAGLRQLLGQPLLTFMNRCLGVIKKQPTRGMKLLGAIDTTELTFHGWRALAQVRTGLGAPNANAAVAEMLAKVRAVTHGPSRDMWLIEVAQALSEVGDTTGAATLIREVWSGGKFIKEMAKAGSMRAGHPILTDYAQRMAKAAAADPKLAASIMAAVDRGTASSRSFGEVVGSVQAGLELLKGGNSKAAQKAFDQAERRFLKLDRSKRRRLGNRRKARAALVRANIALKRWGRALPYVSVVSLGDLVSAAKQDVDGRKWLESVAPNLLRLEPWGSKKTAVTNCADEFARLVYSKRSDEKAFAARCYDYLKAVRATPDDGEFAVEPVRAAGLLSSNGKYTDALMVATGAHVVVQNKVLQRVAIDWIRAGKPEIDGIQAALALFVPKPPSVDTYLPHKR